VARQHDSSKIVSTSVMHGLEQINADLGGSPPVAAWLGSGFSILESDLTPLEADAAWELAVADL
jgi:hypothetical protein